MRRLVWLLVPLVAGCASRHRPVAEVAPPPPPPPVVAAPALPPGATPGMRIPAVLADGSYPTPNRGLTSAAAVWHLRAGLNVAALACQGRQGMQIIASYNAMLQRYKAALAAAEASYAAEYRGGGGDWRDRYDDAMTRLYNYFSQTPARPALCAAAEQLLAEAVSVPPEGLATFAQTGIGRLDQPFIDFYRAYDAWRNGTGTVVPSIAPSVIAVSASQAQVQAQSDTRAAPPAAPAVAARSYPRLTVDPSIFRMP